MLFVCCIQQVQQLLGEMEKAFTPLLVAPSMDLLDTFPTNLWNHLRSVLDTAVAGGRELLKKGLEGYKLPTEKWEDLFESIRESALKLQDSAVREVAHNALSRMKDRCVALLYVWLEMSQLNWYLVG